jgi:hypothetical protein
VLEFRLERARTTKDIDLRLLGPTDGLLEKLQQAGRRDLGDFLTFEVQPDREHPELQNEGMQYDGYRFRAECRLAGKLYGQSFGVDAAFGDPMLGEPELIVADDTLAFVGVSPPTLRLYPLETHIAEKLHAYTQPRKRPNTRVKDLPDLALLATVRPLEARQLRAALDQTFGFRRTHALPGEFPDPPAAWESPFANLAAEAELSWGNLADVTRAARAFLEPVLKGDRESTWNPKTWSWSK